MNLSTPAVLDACVCINLAAALPDGIASLQGGRFLLVPQVKSEALFLQSDDGEEVHADAVDLAELEVTDLSENELEAYVRFAVRLDDGEAASLAVASARGWVLATDDRAARSTASLQRPPILVVTTPTLLRNHATAVQWSHDDISRAVRAVRDRARFVAPKDDPQFGWWADHLNGA